MLARESSAGPESHRSRVHRNALCDVRQMSTHTCSAANSQPAGTRTAAPRARPPRPARGHPGRTWAAWTPRGRRVDAARWTKERHWRAGIGFEYRARDGQDGQAGRPMGSRAGRPSRHCGIAWRAARVRVIQSNITQVTQHLAGRAEPGGRAYGGVRNRRGKGTPAGGALRPIAPIAHRPPACPSRARCSHHKCIGKKVLSTCNPLPRPSTRARTLPRKRARTHTHLHSHVRTHTPHAHSHTLRVGRNQPAAMKAGHSARSAPRGTSGTAGWWV